MKEEELTLTPSEYLQLGEAIGAYVDEVIESGEDLTKVTNEIISGQRENPFEELLEDMRLTKGSRYLGPKTSSKDSSSFKNPYAPASHQRPKHQRIAKSRVKFEQQDYVEARQLLNLFLHDPNPYERERANAALEVALQKAANFFHESHIRNGLYHAFKGVAGVFKAAKDRDAKATAYASRVKSMKKESAYAGGALTEAINQGSSDSFIEAYAKVRAAGYHMEQRNGKAVIVEDAVQPKGHGYDTSSMTSTNPRGLDLGTSDNSKQKLTEPQLPDPHGVHWSKFFLDRGGGSTVGDDEEMMALFNALAKKLGFNTVE